MKRVLPFLVLLAVAGCARQPSSAPPTGSPPVAEIPVAEPQPEEEGAADGDEPEEPEKKNAGEASDDAKAAEIAGALADLDLQTIGAIGPAGTSGPVLGATNPGPRGSASVGGATVQGGSVSNASAVVARMRGRFRRCYQAGLSTHRKLEGSVTLVAHINAQGGVMKVTGTSAELAPIIPCLKAVIVSGGFAPPQGGVATVSVPISFVNVK